MLDVAEAVIRVFHRYGDRKHMQRNRMKFLIRSLGWDEWRARFDKGAPRNSAPKGGAPLPFSAAGPLEEAPSWPRPAPPTPKMAAALAETTVKGPGIVPGSVRLQTLPDAYVRWTRSNVRRHGRRATSTSRRVCRSAISRPAGAGAG